MFTQNRALLLRAVFWPLFLLIACAAYVLPCGNPQWSKAIYIFQTYWWPPEKEELEVPVDYDGAWRTWYRDGGLRSKGNYSNGLPDGLHRFWHRNGALFQEDRYANGESSGGSTIWNEDGSTNAVYSYRDGELHGDVRLWYPNGNLRTVVPFREGLREGKQQKWDTAGNVTSEVWWAQDEVVTNGAQFEESDDP